MNRRKANLSIDEDLLSYIKTRSAATGESMALIVNNSIRCLKSLEEVRKAEAVTLRQIHRIVRQEASRARSTRRMPRVPASVFKAAGIDAGIKHHNHRSSRLEAGV